MYVGFLLGTFFCSAANSYLLLLIARIFTGVFGGVMTSIVHTIIADIYKDKLRGRAMGYVQMSLGAGQIIGIPMGIFIATHFSWTTSFLFIVVIGVLNLLLIIWKIAPITAHLSLQNESKPLANLVHILSTKSYLLSFSAVMFVSIGGYMLLPFASLYLVNNLGISRFSIPIVYMSSGIANLILMPIIGRLCDQFSRKTIFTIGSLLAIILINIYTHLPILSLVVFIPFNILLFATIMMRLTPLFSINAGVPVQKDRGAYLSLSSSVQQIAGGIGSIIGGIIIKQYSVGAPLNNMDLLGYIMSVVFVIGILLVYNINTTK